MADGRVAAADGGLAAAGAVPVAWLAVTLENWLFLLFPTRTQADGGQQNAFMGKQIIKMLFKMVDAGRRGRGGRAGGRWRRGWLAATAAPRPAWC